MTFDERLELLRQRHRLLRAGVVVAPRERRARQRINKTARTVRRRPEQLPGRSKKRSWQAYMAAMGLCQCCGKGELVTANHCDACRIKNNIRVANRRYKLGGTPRQVRNRCGVCGEVGHNARHWMHRKLATAPEATT